MVQKTLKSHKRQRHMIMTSMLSLLTLCCFTFSINLSPTFADTLKDIPVLGSITELLTFTESSIDEENISGTVSIPEVHIVKDLDDIINSHIKTQTDLILEEAILRAEEYKTAYLETGGTEAGYEEKNMSVTVDHEIYSKDTYLSFRVFTHETLAAVYSSNMYFNINIEDEQLLSLQDILGDDYQDIIYKTVQSAVNEAPDMYFEETIKGEWQVREDLDFYIKDKTLIVVFQKYELASGANGRLEYDIQKIK